MHRIIKIINIFRVIHPSRHNGTTSGYNDNGCRFIIALARMVVVLNFANEYPISRIPAESDEERSVH